MVVGYKLFMVGDLSDFRTDERVKRLEDLDVGGRYNFLIANKEVRSVIANATPGEFREHRIHEIYKSVSIDSCPVFISPVKDYDETRTSGTSLRV